jgi:hypothetical protein
MFVPIAALVFLLAVVLIASLVRAKHRYVDHYPEPPDIRPNDRAMTAEPDLTNPPTLHPDELRGTWIDDRRPRP